MVQESEKARIQITLRPPTGTNQAFQEDPGTRRERDLPAPATYVRNTQSSKSVVVRFTSTPPDAETLGRRRILGSKRRPLIWTRLLAGPHTILVKKLGYQAWERKVTLSPGDARTVAAELQPESNDSSKPRILGNN